MPLEEIRRRIIEEAKKKRDEAINWANAERNKIISGAKEEAKKIEESAKARAEEASSRIINEYIAEYEVERHNALITAQEEVAERWLNDAKKEFIEALLDNYKKVVESALKRIEEEGEGGKLVVGKKYAPIIKKLGYKYEEGGEGVVAASLDGKISIDITPEKIASEEEDIIKSMIVEALFKGSEAKKGKSRKNEEKRLGKRGKSRRLRR